MTRIRVHIYGAFRVEGEAGELLTPTGTKDQGLLILLLSSATGERARSWLQDKLWSDRGREQASASLRQSLSKIRRAFKGYGDILSSDRRAVRLDMQRIDIVEAPDQEFAEGLDVKDQEFEYWLAAERLARSASSAKAAPTPMAGVPETPAHAACDLPHRILLSTNSVSDPDLAWFGTVVSGNLVNLLGEAYSFPIIPCGPETIRDRAWCVKVETAFQPPDHVGIKMELSDAESQRALWCGHRSVRKGKTVPTNHQDILQLVHQLIDAIGNTMISHRSDEHLPEQPDLLATLAVRRLLTGQADHVASADRLLARAYDLDPRGTHLAWQAQLREIQFVEGLRQDMDELHREARDLSDRALDREPNNALVLALTANAKLYLDMDIATGLDFAKRSVRLQSVNPFGWWALSAARYFIGDLDNSARNAKFAHFLMQRTALSLWADGMLAGTQLAHGQIKDESRLQAVAAGQRHFRPGLRLLLARYGKTGAWDKAQATSSHLYELDPGFSIQRILRDPDYPRTLFGPGSKSA